MRVLAVIMLLLVTGCARTPNINSPPRVTADRSWVPDDAVIYGQDLPHGFFRFALNQAQPEELGNSVGFVPEALLISPDKSKVYADASGPATIEPHYIYDAKTGTVRDLGSLIPPNSLPAISPDWHYIAWTNFRDPGVHIVDLHSNTARTIQMPAPASKALILEPNWSSGGDVLVARRPYAAGTTGWTYWKIDPVSGQVTQIEGRNQAGTLSYIENGVTIGVSCPLCGGTRAVNQIKAPSGVVAYIDADHDLIVRDSDGALNIVQKHVPPPAVPAGSPACGCGPAGKYPVLWTIFDNDVLLYSFGRDLWVYGIREHAKSSLGIAPIVLAF